MKKFGRGLSESTVCGYVTYNFYVLAVRSKSMR